MTLYHWWFPQAHPSGLKHVVRHNSRGHGFTIDSMGVARDLLGEDGLSTPPVPFSPRAELRHRCRVYKFGPLWFWKCLEPRCRGGRKRSQAHAFTRAEQHCQEQGQEE